MTKSAPTLLLAVTFASAVTAVFALDRHKELPTPPPGERLDVAKNFQLADLHGVRVELSELEASVVLLHFWSKYRDCKYDLEVLQTLHEKYDDQDLQIVGIVFSSGTRKEIEAFTSELGVEFPNLMCTNEVRSAYDVATFPTTFLLDSEKRIRYWMYGILVDSHWDRLIEELLEESTGAQPTPIP